MGRLLLTIALRLGLCALPAWFFLRFGFPAGLPFVGALAGLLLAKPLIDLASDVRHQIRRAAYHGIQGQHYAWHGRPVRVIEDEHGQRWVRADDLRTAAATSATDITLRAAYGSGCRMHARALHLGEEALLEHLARSPAPNAAAVREWARRDIVMPARQGREQRGLDAPSRLAAEDSTP